MKLSIQKWGNSAGVRLPAPMLQQIGAKIGDCLDVEITADTAVLKVAKPSYCLTELLSEMPEGLPRIAAWDEMADVGQEI